MKKTLLLCLLSAPLLYAQTDVPPAQVSAPGPLTTAIDGYAARVNSTIITYGDVRESARPYLMQIMQQYKGAELAQRIQAALLDTRNLLIEEELLKAEIKTLNLAPPEKLIEEEISRILREKFGGDRVRLSRALTDRRMTYEEWKKEVSDQVAVRLFYLQEVTRRAAVSAEAVRAEYDRTRETGFIPFRVKYRFILINKGTTDGETAARRKLAEETLHKLRDGADFAATAKEVSEGDSAEGPWRDPADVREELRPALRSTPAGQLSGLIETPDAFYILRVDERREEGYIPFEEARKEIEKRLLAAERDRLHKALLDRLAAKHFVVRY